MQALTGGQPKHLVRLGHQSLFDRLLGQLEMVGITNLAVVVRSVECPLIAVIHQWRSQFRLCEAMATSGSKAADLVGCLRRLVSWQTPESLIVMGDLVLDDGELRRFVERGTRDCELLVGVTMGGRKASGVAVVGDVARFTRGLTEARRFSAGIYAASLCACETIIQQCWDGREGWMHEVMNEAVRRLVTRSHALNGVIDVNTPEDYTDALRAVGVGRE